jgi:hypothetical protein
MEPRKPAIVVRGPVAEHDQCCAVYNTESAVLDLSEGVFKPSWRAQRIGWHLIRARTRMQRLALRIFFQESGNG